MIDQLTNSSVSAAASTLHASQSNAKLLSSNKVKESIIKAREFIERRINDEQKFVKIRLKYYKLIKLLIILFYLSYIN